MSSRRSLVVFVLAAAAAWCSAAEATDLLAKVRASGEVSCQPSHPVFCANVHVTCVGPTRTSTFPFHLRATATSGTVTPVGEAAALDGLYSNAIATWDAPTQSLILTPAASNGYVRLQSDGRYVFRYYVGAVGVMSLGRCE